MPPRPGPAPGRPTGRAGAAPVPVPATPDEVPPTRADTDDGTPFADLDRRPVAEHVAVFEAEHARLQRELGTIDQL